MLEQNVNIKKLRDDAKIPTYGTEHAAGCDLYACMDEPVTIKEMAELAVSTLINLKDERAATGCTIMNVSLVRRGTT